jgi:hypothetical protein
LLYAWLPELLRPSTLAVLGRASGWRERNVPNAKKGEGRSPNPAAPTFEHIANIPGMTGMALTATLRTSHGTMPNVIIKGSDIGDLVAYILSLKDGASR